MATINSKLLLSKQQLRINNMLIVKKQEQAWFSTEKSRKTDIVQMSGVNVKISEN